MSKSLLLAGLLAWLTVIGSVVGSAARVQDSSAQAGDLTFATERAETRATIELASFPEPFVPVGGEYLIVWLTATNNGAGAVDYDYCPADAACFNPAWFAAVDERGAAYPVDELVRAAFEQSEPEVHRFGGEILPGETARLVVVFDVAPGAASWTISNTDTALASFSLPLSLSPPVVVPEEAPLYAGMNQVVPAGGIELVATRAELRAEIDLASHPEPFLPQGEYIVVYLTLTNAGDGPAEYDICPPDGRRCLSQLWFELADPAGRVFPVEPIVWAAFSMSPNLLPFGSELAAAAPEPVALVFDVPAGVEEWWLISTPEAPRRFFIQLELSAAPGSIQVLGPTAAGEAGGAGAAVELILDTSGSMLQPLEGRRRIDIAKEVLGALVTETIPPGTPLALRAFGTTPESCETTLAAPLQPLDPASMTGLVAGLDAIDGVNTPIGASLEQVAGDLQGAAGTKIVVLVTDGEETCGGDPAASLRALAAQGTDVRVNIVGFAVEDEALKAQFREWAHLGNGRYFDAAGSAELGEAVAAAVQPPFRILDAAGNDVGGGLVDGEPVEVPAGAYDVVVLSAAPETIGNVVVTSGARVEVVWDDR